MYSFDITPGRPKAELYDELFKAADALTNGEPDGIANMANIAALLWQFLPNLNWSGAWSFSRQSCVHPYSAEQGRVRRSGAHRD